MFFHFLWHLRSPFANKEKATPYLTPPDPTGPELTPPCLTAPNHASPRHAVPLPDMTDLTAPKLLS